MKKKDLEDGFLLLHVVAQASRHKENCAVFTELFTQNLATSGKKGGRQEIKRNVGDLEYHKQEIGLGCPILRRRIFLYLWLPLNMTGIFLVLTFN